MNKIALITDSTSDLSQEVIEKYDIKLVPFRIIYKDKEYRDGIDITAEEVYNRLTEEIPTTSIPTFSDVDNLYQELKKEGYTHAIVITISSGLSSVQNVFKLVSMNYPDIVTHIFDSKSISLGEGIFVELCGEMIQEGKSFEEIVNLLPEIKKKTKVYFVVDTLEYLKKGGRIGKVLGTISEMLNIKPIISIDEEGKYFTFDKVRGRKNSLNKIIEIGKKILEEKKCKIYIMSGAAHQEAKQVLEKLSQLKNVVSVKYGGNISPVSGVHSGPGLVGVLFLEV